MIIYKKQKAVRGHHDFNHQFARSPLLWLGLILSSHAVAYDGPSELGLVVQATSDWIYDGTTETRGEPSIGINGEWRLQPAIFLGFEAHEARVAAKRQRERSVAAYMGIDHTLGKDWYTALSLQHREFPGSGIAWGFTELALQFAYRDNWSFMLDYSPDYYSLDTEAFGAELSYTDTISSRSYWSVQTGAQEFLDAQFIDYHYARVGIGLSIAAFNIDLSYGWNSEDGSLLPTRDQRILSPEFVLQLNYRLK